MELKTPAMVRIALVPFAQSRAISQSVPKRRAKREGLSIFFEAATSIRGRTASVHHRRRHEGDRAPAGRTVRQPDRLQGERERRSGEGTGPRFVTCEIMTDSKSDITWPRETSGVWAVGGDVRARDRVKGEGV